MRITVNTETDFENLLDDEIEVNKVSWYSVKARLSETQEEQDERKLAMKYQIDNGILQKNGLPAGMTTEQYQKYQKEVNNKNNGSTKKEEQILQQKPRNKFERKMQRELERKKIKEQKMTQVKLQRKMALEQSKRHEQALVKSILNERMKNGNNV